MFTDYLTNGPSILVIVAAGSLTVGCKTRTSVNSSRQSSTSVSSSPLLTDSPEFLSGDGPMRRIENRLVMLRENSEFDFISDLKMLGRTEFTYDTLTFLSVSNKAPALTYVSQNENLGSSALGLGESVDLNSLQKAFNPSPARFGAATILEVMRANLVEFSRVGLGGEEQEPRFFGLKRDFESFAPAWGATLEKDYESLFSMSDPRKTFSTTRCLSLPTHFMSDLRYHYTCQIPGIYRACYRFLVGKHFNLVSGPIMDDFRSNKTDAASTLESIRTAGADDHKFTVAHCSEGGDSAQIPDATLQAFKGKQPSGRDLDLYRKAFSVFRKSQERTVSPGVTVNIFDYILTSSPYDFDYEQQQAMLNAFYGALKPKALAPFDPADKDDCKTYRDIRPNIDATDGTHCLATTQKQASLYSNGR